MKKGCALVLLLAVTVAACGKKGPPLPPLVRVPVAPAELTAERLAATAELQFTIPATNTDGTRPANIERVDVYALTGPPPVTAEQIVRLGAKIGSVAVKAPRDPDAVADPDDPDADLEALQGAGLDQGAQAHVREVLTSAGGTAAPEDQRHYVGVGISTRGRRGLLSKPVSVSLRQPPPSPGKPEAAYDEAGATLTWAAARATAGPSDAPPLAYHVYEMPAASVAAGREARLTKGPIDELHFVDPRIEWAASRCYTIRSVNTLDGLVVESDASPPVCVTFVDTFPPAAPVGVTPVGSSGTINLTWDPNAEKDLQGYVILRGSAPDGPLRPVTPVPIPETSFNDIVEPGIRYSYAVQAVDKAGNTSPPSARVEAAAR